MSDTVMSASRLLFPVVLAATAMAQITPGNLAVVRVGDGSAALSSAATAVFLDQYTPAGVLVSSIPLSAQATPFTNAGSATAEAFLNLSLDGQYLLCAGYAVAPGLASVAASTAATAPRTIARIALNGTVDLSTNLGTAYSANGIRSVVSDNGQNFWTSASNGGVQYVVYGTNLPTQLNSVAPTNNRVLGLYNGQLYVTSASGAFQGLSMVGTGLPTTSGQTLVLQPGFPTATGPSPYDFYFADANTLYLADDRPTVGGIQKWALVGGTWVLQYTLNGAPLVGCRGLTGITTAGTTTLFATTTAGTLVTVTDFGPGATFTILATAATNTAFRGIRAVGIPASVAVYGAGSPTTVGTPTIAGSGLPTVGNGGFAVTGAGYPAFGLGALLLDLGNLGAGVPVPGAPATALLYVFPIGSTLLQLADANGATLQPFAIPANPGLAGLPVVVQHVVLDPLMLDPVQIGTSAGLRLVVGN